MHYIGTPWIVQKFPAAKLALAGAECGPSDNGEAADFWFRLLHARHGCRRPSHRAGWKRADLPTGITTRDRVKSRTPDETGKRPDFSSTSVLEWAKRKPRFTGRLCRCNGFHARFKATPQKLLPTATHIAQSSSAEDDINSRNVDTHTTSKPAD